MADQEKVPLVGIIMGSKSDLPTMEGCTKELEELGVPYELVIASAHRNPDKVHEWAGTAHERGLKVIIAAAGKAAHLGGVGCRLHAASRDWRPHEDERPRRARFPALHGADAFWCSGCVRRHQRCQERCHLRYADSRCHHARVPRCYFQDEAGDGRGVTLRRRRGASPPGNVSSTLQTSMAMPPKRRACVSRGGALGGNDFISPWLRSPPRPCRTRAPWHLQRQCRPHGSYPRDGWSCSGSDWPYRHYRSALRKTLPRVCWQRCPRRVRTSSRAPEAS